MFKLRNKIGNVHRVVKSERERDALIADGYIDVDAEKAAPKAKKAAKEAAVNKAGDAE